MKAGRKSRYLSIQHTLRGQDSRTLLKPRFKGCSRLLGVGPGHSTSRHLGPGPGLSTVGSSGDSARTPFCLAAEFRIEHFQILAIQVKRSKRWAHSSLIVCTNISKKGPVEALGRPGPLGQVAQKSFRRNAKAYTPAPEQGRSTSLRRSSNPPSEASHSQLGSAGTFKLGGRGWPPSVGTHTE